MPQGRPNLGRYLTTREVALIRELRADGYTLAEVADVVGCSDRTVQRYAPGYVSKLSSPIRELRADGYTATATAEIVGCSATTVKHYAPGRIGKVPVAPLREAFLASPLTAADVARELGWWAGKDADVSRVRRTLGLLDDVNGAGKRSRRTLV